jgi:hypothetical protein
MYICLLKTGYSGWLNVCVGGPLRANLVFGFSIGQDKIGN